MAQIGQEVVDRPTPGQSADDVEALEEVKDFSKKKNIVFDCI
jgi:hypothetical protein